MGLFNHLIQISPGALIVSMSEIVSGHLTQRRD